VFGWYGQFNIPAWSETMFLFIYLFIYNKILALFSNTMLFEVLGPRLIFGWCEAVMYQNWYKVGITSGPYWAHIATKLVLPQLIPGLVESLLPLWIPGIYLLYTRPVLVETWNQCWAGAKVGTLLYTSVGQVTGWNPGTHHGIKELTTPVRPEAIAGTCVPIPAWYGHEVWCFIFKTNCDGTEVVIILEAGLAKFGY
jgi:hypothetical protein